MAEPEYTYRADIVRWVDGDTVDVVVDVGFRVHTDQRLRLYGIDTPERGQPMFAEATARANTLAPPGSVVVVRTFKTPGKYGRFLAYVYGPQDQRSVNDLLLEAGLAVPYPRRAA